MRRYHLEPMSLALVMLRWTGCKFGKIKPGPKDVRLCNLEDLFLLQSKMRVLSAGFMYILSYDT